MDRIIHDDFIVESYWLQLLDTSSESAAMPAAMISNVVGLVMLITMFLPRKFSI